MESVGRFVEAVALVFPAAAFADSAADSAAAAGVTVAVTVAVAALGFVAVPNSHR